MHFETNEVILYSPSLDYYEQKKKTDFIFIKKLVKCS